MGTEGDEWGKEGLMERIQGETIGIEAHLGSDLKTSCSGNFLEFMRVTLATATSTEDRDLNRPSSVTRPGFQLWAWGTSPVMKPSIYALSPCKDVLGQWRLTACGHANQ